MGLSNNRNLVEKRNRADWSATIDSLKYFRLYKEGKTISEIAYEFGVAERRVALLIERRLRIEEARNK